MQQENLSIKANREMDCAKSKDFELRCNFILIVIISLGNACCKMLHA